MMQVFIVECDSFCKLWFY